MIEDFLAELWQILASTLRISTPLILAALGGLISERSGVIQIALEGLMLVGAFTAAAFAAMTGSPEWGVCMAILASMTMAAFYGFTVIPLKANQIVAGMAVNMIAFGLTPFLCKIFYGSTSSTPGLPFEARLQTGLVWIAGLLVFLVGGWIRFSASGLWVRFAGENPQALDAAGISVNRVRWIAILVSGMFCGLAGASLSIFLASSFSRNMTAGRGFIALAAMIFGKWQPFPTVLACLFFAFADALQIRLQVMTRGDMPMIPIQLIQIIPYLVTVLVLAGFVGHCRAPRSLGLPFIKG